MPSKNYNTTEDFVEDYFFREWVLGNLPAYNIYWKNYLKENADKHEIFNQARSLVFALQMNNATISDDEVQQEVDRFYKTLNINKPKTKRSIWEKYLIMAAASFMILFGLTWILIQYQPIIISKITKRNTFQPVENLIEKTNSGFKPMTIILSDGSRVVLQKNSKISYPLVFNADKRELHLVGEAFFDIKRDITKPFLVYSQDLVTKVLGTSFTISAYKTDSEIKVSVKTGKVSIISKNNFDKEREKPDFQTDGLILTPNQQAVYFPEKETFLRTLVSDPIPLITKKVSPKLIFNDTPLFEVFDELEAFYGIKIIYDDQTINFCTLKADLSDDSSFYDKINIICKSMNGSYEVIDGQLVITTKGCDL